MPTKRPSGVYAYEDFPGDTVLSCDAVVVGSGAGGAVVAAELAEGGLDVIVLEEGGYHPTEEFDTDVQKAVRTYYRDGGATVSVGSPPVQFTEGRMVGGSTVINGGMSWRTPEKILERWGREDMVADVAPGEMDRYFARVEKYISAKHQDPHTVGRDNQLLKEGADKLNWKVIPNIRNQFHCAGTNNCAFGCPTGAKRSTLVTYIPRALAFGARVYSDCKVEELLTSGKRVTGVRARVVGPGGRPGAKVTIHARLVVCSAGAIHTPALLLRSGIRSPSGRIGMNLTLHPNCKVVAIFDEKVEGWKGVHQAYQVREFQDEGFLFAAVNIPPGVVSMATPAYGNALGEILADYNRIVIAGMLCEDTTSGRVRVAPGGRPVAFYDLSDFDAARLVRGTSLLCRLLFTAGAKKIYLPFDGVPALEGIDDVKRIFARRIPKDTMEVVTVHMMGTAAMGGDPTRHVCDSYGKVYDTDGLWVADASLFPSPVGVNPMETIMALATRNAERILDSQAARRAA